TGTEPQLALGQPAAVGEVGGVDPHAVAAHLGDAAVGVAVVHEPLDVVGGHRALGERGPPHHPQHPVCADAAFGVAQRGDASGGEVEGTVGVGENDEAVLRAVPLAEL